jgi:putative ABC transport system permease protein
MSLWDWLFRRRQREEDLDEEVQSHLRMATQERIEQGQSAEQARTCALREFGNVALVKETARDMWGWGWLETWLQDVRYGARQWRRNPGFTLAAVLTLALGIGANTAIFSLLNALLFRNLPVRQPEQVVEISMLDRNGQTSSLSFPMFEEIVRHEKVFSGTFAWLGDATFNVEVNGAFTQGDIWAVTGNFYSELGVRPVLGRVIEPVDVNLRGGSPANVAVLGYRFWQRSFGGDPAVIGKSVRVEGLPFTVVGVAPKGFTGMGLASDPDITLPLTAEPLLASQPLEKLYTSETSDDFWLEMAGRLKDGVTLALARAEMEVLWRGVLERTVPAKYDAQQRASYLAARVDVASAAKGMDRDLRSHFTRPLVVLLAIAGLLLLIACVNLASLMLARAAARSHEMGVRAALGASRWRLARQLLTESTLLSAAGAAAGLAIANWSSVALRNLMDVPPAFHVGPDVRVLGFTAVAAILTGILFGLAPVWQVTRQDPTRVIPQESRTIAATTGRFGKALISAQVALSLVLLMGAGLFARSLHLLRSLDPGFQREGVLLAQLFPRPNGYKDMDNSVYYSDLIRRVRGLPGVLAASLSPLPPGWVTLMPQKTVAAAMRPEEASRADVAMVSPGFFQTLGISLLIGRDFNWQDNERAPRVAILSRQLAQQLFPGGAAIGQHINIGEDAKQQNVEVVGVVTDVRLYDVRNPNVSAVYMAVLQEGEFAHYEALEVRSAGDPTVLASSVRQTVDSLGREYVLRAGTLSYADDVAFLNERIIAILSEFFGGLALLLVATGLYGLMAYSVTRRTREIGIRVALGAEQQGVLWMVMRESLGVVMTGVAIGLPAALVAPRLISSMLFGLTPTDPLTIGMATVAMIGVTLVAAYLPAHRASRVEPMAALRYE